MAKHELEFREPVTLRMLEEACAVAGFSVDDILDNTAKTLQDKGLTLTKIKKILPIILVTVPDLGSMPIEEAEALGTLAISDFFLNVYERRLRERIRVWSKSGNGAAFQKIAEAQHHLPA